MELNKTLCNDCGYLNAWYGYKLPSYSPERQEHNRINARTCIKCGSTNVKNHEDDDTMDPYRFVASLLTGTSK